MSEGADAMSRNDPNSDKTMARAAACGEPSWAGTTRREPKNRPRPTVTP
jgi:hypothetical protein